MGKRHAREGEKTNCRLSNGESTTTREARGVTKHAVSTEPSFRGNQTARCAARSCGEARSRKATGWGVGRTRLGAGGFARDAPRVLVRLPKARNNNVVSTRRNVVRVYDASVGVWQTAQPGSHEERLGGLTPPTGAPNTRREV